MKKLLIIFAVLALTSCKKYIEVDKSFLIYTEENHTHEINVRSNAKWWRIQKTENGITNRFTEENNQTFNSNHKQSGNKKLRLICAPRYPQHDGMDIIKDSLIFYTEEQRVIVHMEYRR